jgi:DivIVA domain-containing protein
VDIDRQAIERRDFPIARRGYDPAAVDAHLRLLANEIEDLQRELTDGGQGSSLASTAGTQVQSILAAAEAAAADIERQALADATSVREDADADAARTREQAIEQARARVAAVTEATTTLLERVGSMDGEVNALVEILRAGAGRLADDLAAVDTNMEDLYDAASGSPSAPTRAAAAAAEPQSPSVPAPPRPAPPIPSPPTPQAPVPARPPRAPARGGGNGGGEAEAHRSGSPAAEDGDLDGARLIALNMALNGESRADADRYLAENFQLADRQKLIDEVYAAIEG